MTCEEEQWGRAREAGPIGARRCKFPHRTAGGLVWAILALEALKQHGAVS